MVEKVDPVTIMATAGSARRLGKCFQWLRQTVQDGYCDVGNSINEVRKIMTEYVTVPNTDFVNIMFKI